MSTEQNAKWLPAIGTVAIAAVIVFAIAVVRADARKTAKAKRTDDDDAQEIVTPIFDASKARQRSEARRQRIDDDAPPSDVSANDSHLSADPSTHNHADVSASSQSSEPSGPDPTVTG